MKLSETPRPIARRDVMRLLGLAGASALLPAGQAWAQARGATLVIGIDISDTITLDPVRQAQYTAPMTLAAAYDQLVTLTPGDYIDQKTALASAWTRTRDGKGWRFMLREGVKFASGAPVTAEDVQFTFERLIRMKEQTQQYVKAIDRCEIVDARTVDLAMTDLASALLNIVCAPSFGITEKKPVMQHGGSMGADAKEDDKATDWLN